jgi:hypothetical protein
MTVTQIRTEQPTTVVRQSPPMNSTVLAHVHTNTTVTATRRTPKGPLELAVGSSEAGTQVVLYLHGDAAVVALIEALQTMYSR